MSKNKNKYKITDLFYKKNIRNLNQKEFYK